MIADLKPYPEYKESGLPWLGQVPGHWGLLRSKRLFSARKNFAMPEDVQLSATQAYGVIPQSEFEEKVGRRVVKISMHLEKRRHVERGDFVISMRSFQGGLERAWASGAIRSSYVVLKPEPGVDVGFFAYLFKSQGYIRALQATADFIRDGQDLNFSNFCRVDLPVVPLAEQAAIVRFLDWANGRLERAIRAKRKVIALLNEQKQAITHLAVTGKMGSVKGEVGSVKDSVSPFTLQTSPFKMKPSGIPWLGDIPQHWGVRRLRTLVHRIDQGVSPLAVGFLAEGDSWGVLKSGCVNRGVFRETEHKQLARSFEIDPALVVKVGDVLISRACGSPTLVGSVGRVKSLHYRLILSDKTFRACFRDCVDVDFMVFAMNCRYYRHQVEQAISGAEGMANNLPLSSLRDFTFAIPLADEAAAIAAHLESETAGLQTTISRLDREIELLREYRTRLVADVVTGKLDVRGAAARLPEGTEGPEPLDETDSLTDIDDAAEIDPGAVPEEGGA
jgi:type I restriction enzyme S subunit